MKPIAVMNKDSVDIYLPEGVFTLTNEEYKAGKQLLTSGFDVSEAVIRPNSLINYIEEYNPTSIDTLVETEVTRKTRGMGQDTMKFVQYGTFLFLVLLGVGVLYMLLNQGDATAARAAVPAAQAATGITIT